MRYTSNMTEVKKVKKNYFLSLAIVTMLLFSSILVLSANGETVLETWRNPQTGIEVFVNPYNHDNSVYRGPEYQVKILELIANGYVHKNYSITENSGGGRPQFGTYDEDYFVKTNLNIVFNDWGLDLFFRTTGAGLEYFDGNDCVDVPEEMEVPVEVEELLLQGVFNHEAYQQTGQHWVQIFGPIGFWMPDFGWEGTGKAHNEPFGTVINEDGTEATWTIMYLYGISVAMMVVTGEEEWDTRTVVFDLPQGPVGGPQLLPLYYGVQILGTLYGPQSIDEIPEELMIYAIELNGQYYTYSGSPLDIWIYENIYKPNHAKSFL